MSPKVPRRPMITPVILFCVTTARKNAAPTISVNNGVVAFNIEAMALSISVSAKAKKYTGKNDPRDPEITIHFHCFPFSFIKLRKPINIRNSAAKMILKDPTCKGLNPTSAFLIRIKELPQTIKRMIR